MEEKKEQLGFHTFAICAYKDSPYLEECMASVKRQAPISAVWLKNTAFPCMCGRGKAAFGRTGCSPMRRQAESS